MYTCIIKQHYAKTLVLFVLKPHPTYTHGQNKLIITSFLIHIDCAYVHTYLYIGMDEMHLTNKLTIKRVAYG